jgi:hypothetical protein
MAVAMAVGVAPAERVPTMEGDIVAVPEPPPLVKM